MPKLSLRCWWCWWCCCGDRLLLLLEVLCDQRLMFSEPPSRKAPMPSAAPLAALERRREEEAGGDGGVARAATWGAGGCWLLAGESLVDSEAALLTVTTEDEDMDVLRDRLWRCECEGADGSCMLASEPAEGQRWCLRIGRH